jgi:hypothetical protein
VQVETHISEIESRLAHLRLCVREVGDEIDAYRNLTAAAMGAGAFFGLLAIGSLYDIATDNASLQIALGVTRVQFYLIAAVLSLLSLTLFVAGILRQKKRDRGREERLEEYERELAELVERKRALGEE